MQFKQFTVLFNYKKDSENLQKELVCHYRAEPYCKIVNHPDIEGRCIMVDASGVNEIKGTAEELVTALG